MKKFNMLDENFKCFHCGNEVTKLVYSARDHCPNCLYSLHVDINPGDRNNSCRGELVPYSIEKYRDTYKILYKCSKCGNLHKNIIASDDNMNEIIRLSTNEKN